jgi:hypothetical protein
MSFAITNNLITANIKATNLRISLQTTTLVAWNNSENPGDGCLNMKLPKRCSYTIPKSPSKDKWGGVVKASTNKVLSKTKVCSN